MQEDVGNDNLPRPSKRLSWISSVATSLMLILMISLLANSNPYHGSLGYADAEAISSCDNMVVSSNSVTAIGYESGSTNYPRNVIDNNLHTRWSNYGTGSWINLDLGSQRTICYVDIGWYNGNIRSNNFVISVSSDNHTFTNVYSGKSSGTTTYPERYNFNDANARYIKITVNGNTINKWASITEIDAYGYSSTTSGPKSNDITQPMVSIDSPTNNAIINVDLTSSISNTVNIVGTASDNLGGSGIKIVEVRTNDGLSYSSATPKSVGDWSRWSKSIKLIAGTHSVVARATDNAGNQRWFIVNVTIKTSAPPTSNLGKDKFGISFLYPSATNGVAWYSTWDNGHARSFDAYASDPDDKWFDSAHGSATYTVDGKGKITATGDYVRMYVHDPAKTREWSENLEITTYITRIRETDLVSYSGLQIFARTNHGTIGNEDTNLCDTRGYGGKVKIDGTWAFEKETAHHLDNGYADPGGVKPWSSLPKNTPVGVKYVIYNIPNTNKVKVELYRDITNGLNGGDWKKIYEYTDDGTNWGKGAAACKGGVNPAMQLIRSLTLSNSETKKPEISVYFRHEYGTMAYEKTSVREIRVS